MPIDPEPTPSSSPCFGGELPKAEVLKLCEFGLWKLGRELPKRLFMGGGAPAGVEEGMKERSGGGPAGVVEGTLRLERRESGVEGGVEEGTRNMAARCGVARTKPCSDEEDLETECRSIECRNRRSEWRARSLLVRVAMTGMAR